MLYNSCGNRSILNRRVNIFFLFVPEAVLLGALIGAIALVILIAVFALMYNHRMNIAASRVSIVAMNIFKNI